MTLDNLSDETKHMGDLVSVGVTMATIANWLPAIAALMTIVWTLIRIWETATVQRMFGRREETSQAGLGADQRE